VASAEAIMAMLMMVGLSFSVGMRAL
jgi:hypothetical protein